MLRCDLVLRLSEQVIIGILHMRNMQATLVQLSEEVYSPLRQEDCEDTEQELSYRQQIARQLRAQYAEGIYMHSAYIFHRDLEVQVKCHSRSLETEPLDRSYMTQQQSSYLTLNTTAARFFLRSLALYKFYLYLYCICNVGQRSLKVIEIGTI